MIDHDEPTPPRDASRLSHAWEQSTFAPNRPVAVELTFTAPDESHDASDRLPLNLGLAIDRSGSMQGEKLDAARRAATGVLEALDDGEHFAAAAFDESVIDISPSVAIDDEARTRIGSRIGGLHAGSTTALFDGFTRAAELVAAGGAAASTDSWVVVLSDGMGNQGLTDPHAMRMHAASLADRGLRTISIGIGEDYEAAQLTALSDGGAGEFHHASLPEEIVEILMGELRSLRTTTARELTVSVTTSSAQRWMLLGGNASHRGSKGRTRFDRVSAGRSVRVVALVWPGEDGARAQADGALPRVNAKAEWLDREGERHSATNLAVRAARLWHARIVARALELNERGEYRQAKAWMQRQRREFIAYVDGLPGMSDLLESLRDMNHRVGSEWRTLGRRESYVMAMKASFARSDLRTSAPVSYRAALEVDKRKR